MPGKLRVSLLFAVLIIVAMSPAAQSQSLAELGNDLSKLLKEDLTLSNKLLNTTGVTNAQTNYSILFPANGTPDRTVIEGDPFNFLVIARQVDELGAFSFQLQYDPAIMNITSLTIGEMIGRTGRTVITIGPNIDNASGTASIGAISLGSDPGAKDSGILAEVNGVSALPGLSAIDIVDASSVTWIEDVDGNRCGIFSTTDGSLLVLSSTTPTPTPTATNTPTPTWTPGGPTATPTETPSPTNTPGPTDTPTIGPSPTPSPTPGGPTPTPCQNFVSPGNGTDYTMDDLTAAASLAGACITKVTGGAYVDYVIRSDVRIQRDDLLIVGTGERLVFTSGRRLLIEGKLEARGADLGTPGQDIVLTSWEDAYGAGGSPGDWAGLTFSNPVITSTLRKVQIKYAVEGIRCINVPQASVVVDECEITNNFTGIFLNNSSPTIERCPLIGFNVLRTINSVVDPNSGTGIMCTFNSKPVITFCEIRDNEANGVGIVSGSNPSLGLFGNKNSPGFNNLFGNGQNEVFNQTSNNISAQNNYWGGAVTTPAIEAIIYDDNDNPASGIVDFSFPAPSPFTFLTDVEPSTWKRFR